VVEKAGSAGAKIDGYFLCPHANPDYVKKKPGVNFDPKLVHDCQCLKPALGMVFEALKAMKITQDDSNVFVIGDRASDVQTALNVSGTGILIPFENEPGEEEKVRKLEEQSQIFIAKDMVEAAKFIVERETRLRK
jgi:histidinol phosphatase-like enzyme